MIKNKTVAQTIPSTYRLYLEMCQHITDLSVDSFLARAVLSLVSIQTSEKVISKQIYVS